MSDTTGIEWTDHTFNPWWGCVKVSPACEHCYAETFAARFGVKWGVKAERKPATEKYWRKPIAWNAVAEKAGKRARVFCASMADVFEDRRDLDQHRARLFSLIESTPWLDWQLLTKRPECIMRLVPETWSHAFPPNVWIGATAEDQRRAEERIPHLLAVPGFNRVGLDLSRWWIIAGGESGPGARPMLPDWARRLRDLCANARVPFFFKQWGRGKKNIDATLDGVQHRAFPRSA